MTNTIATTTKKTIYAVVRCNPKMMEAWDMNIYSKQSSNKEKMEAYAREIKARYPHCKVYLMPREKALAEQRKFYQWRKDQERAKMQKQFEANPKKDAEEKVCFKIGYTV